LLVIKIDTSYHFLVVKQKTTRKGGFFDDIEINKMEFELSDDEARDIGCVGEPQKGEG
jgi:hypothetical protein